MHVNPRRNVQSAEIRARRLYVTLRLLARHDLDQREGRMSSLTPVLHVSYSFCRHTRLAAPWRRLGHHDVWFSHPLSQIDRSGKQLFQVAGLARSGTTLLAGLIDEQPDAMCLSEPFRSWVLHAKSTYDDGVWTRHPSRLVEDQCRRRPERCIGVKETFYSNQHPDGHANEDFFRRNASDGIITIALVRDPRDVYASVEAMLGPRPDVPERFTATWLTFVEWSSVAADCLITYEDLVATPNAVLERVCTTLQIEFDDSRVSLRGRAGEGDKKALCGGSVSTRSIGRFTQRLDRAKALQIEERCGSRMARFGYKTTADST
jgi:hypothetical protein